MSYEDTFVYPYIQCCVCAVWWYYAAFVIKIGLVFMQSLGYWNTFILAFMVHNAWLTEHSDLAFP